MYGTWIATCQGSMENYHILGRIGEGAHGIVSKAKLIQVCHRVVCYQNVDPHSRDSRFLEWRVGGYKEDLSEEIRRWHS